MLFFHILKQNLYILEME